MTVMKNPLFWRRKGGGGRKRREEEEEEEEEEGGGGGGGGERTMKLKMIALKKKIAQKMRSSVKLLRTFKKLLLPHLQKDN